MSKKINARGEFVLKHLLVVFLLIIAMEVQVVEAADPGVVIVQSIATTVHDKIVSGINSALKEQPVIVKVDAVRRIPKPGLFIAIGVDALMAVKDLGVPVVFSMVTNPRSMRINGKEITGVDIFIGVEQQLDQLMAVLPKAKRIGIVYAPSSTGYIVGLAREAAKKRGITLVSRAVRSADEAIVALDSMTDVDVFWMIPDTTLITQELVKHLLLLSLERKIPVCALSEKYVKNGALLALGINPALLGRQIGEMANRVLSGENASSIPIEPVKEGDLYINTTVAKRFKLEISPDVLERAFLYKTGE
jgi:putative ABC transport system substrate-binding protein